MNLKMEHALTRRPVAVAALSITTASTSRTVEQGYATPQPRSFAWIAMLIPHPTITAKGPDLVTR